jgi:4-hydroxybenzoate polyprenyltransferase
MKLLNFTRHSEWWEYKLVPLLAVGYAAIYLNNYAFDRSILRLLFLLLSIIVGAVYVSVINDVTDIKEDARAGKKNRMANLPLWKQVLIVTICLLSGLYFAMQIYPDKLSLFLYVMAWIVFSLYSIPPARLKKRGIWGAFCDASGAHFFPTLLIVCNLAFIAGTTYNIIWVIATGIWAFSYGLRGILWHQFYDRENDLASGTTTFASTVDPEKFKMQELLLFIIEVCAFSVVLFNLFNLYILLSLLFYLLLVLIRKLAFGYKSTFIISPKTEAYQLLMNDYYLVFFPLALLLTLSLNYKYGWVVLCIHLLLFPQKILHVARDYWIFAKSKI